MLSHASAPDEKLITLQYVAHIVAMTGKTRESMEVNGVDTISDLLDKLDQKYPGFKDTFCPLGGIFNSRTTILVRRAGRPTFSIIRQEETIEDGDILTLW